VTHDHQQIRNKIATPAVFRLINGFSLRFVAPSMIACLMATSSAAQTARDVRGAAAAEPLQNEPPAKIVIDPPLPEPLLRGRVVIQYRTENLHIVPVFGPAALAVSPRVGHIHVTVDGAAWVWADASGEPVVLNGLPPGPHKIRIQLETANHQQLDEGAATFTVPKAPRAASAPAPYRPQRSSGEDHRRCSCRGGAIERRGVHCISYREPAHCAGLWISGARRGSPDWTRSRDGR